MNTPAPIASIDGLVADFAAQAAKGNALLPLAALIARLRDPLRDAASWARAADALLRGGFVEPAAALLGAALTHHAGHAELHYLRGNALRVSGHLDEAQGELRAALDAQPAHRNAALSLAFMLREHGRVDAAAAVVRDLAPHESDPERTLALIEFLRESAALPAARAIADSARARWPAHARIAAAAGELALALGDFAAARAALSGALALEPRLTSPWLRLSYCQRYASPDAADAARFRSAFADERLPDAARTCAGFALGKLLDDVDDWRAAAAVFAAANARARAASDWSAARWQATVDAQLARDALPALEPDRQFIPVFIVGLPRTGTTLVATRLARHAALRDRGELNWIGAMFEHVRAQDALGDRSALASVAALIRAQMRRDDAPARCYVDKNPLNFRYLNFIAALFPNARVIRCRRGARDTALSLWSQHFAHPDLGFSYDFAAIARVQESERALLAHWRNALALPILDVDYEAFVAAEEEQLARIAGFLELSDAPGAGDVDHAVTTASVWQARQPVYARSVGRWRRYAEFVPALTEAIAQT